MKTDFIEFLVSVVGVLVGLAVGKQVAVWLAQANVPISSGDPLVVNLPGKGETP